MGAPAADLGIALKRWRSRNEHRGFTNMRTKVRRFNRVASRRGTAAAAVAGKRRADADSAEEGECSDTGASVASSSMSKLARQARNGFDIR